MQDLSDFSMHDLFRLEAESQTAVLTSGLLALERDAADPRQLEELMRAAHSLKGAARIVGLDAAVRVAHHMEDCFVAAQEGKLTLGRAQTDRLLQGVDLLSQFAPDAGERSGSLERGASGRDHALGFIDDRSRSGAARHLGPSDRFTESAQPALRAGTISFRPPRPTELPRVPAAIPSAPDKTRAAVAQETPPAAGKVAGQNP